MKLHPLRVVGLVVVAVDALSVFLQCAQYVVVDHTLVIVLQAPLVDGQSLVGYKRGGYQSVADIGIDGVGRHIDTERLVACPLVIRLCEDIHLYLASLGFFCQSFPFLCRGLHLVRIHHFLITRLVACDHVGSGIVEHKRQRSDINRYGHVHIVGVYLGQLVRLLVVGRQLGTAASSKEKSSKKTHPSPPYEGGSEMQMNLES